MAQQLVTDIQSVVVDRFQDPVVDAFNRRAKTLMSLPVEDAEGQLITWAAALTDNTPGSIYVAEGTGVSTPNSADAWQKAHLDFARCIDSFSISDIAEAKAFASSNPSGLVPNLREKDLNMAAARMAEKMNVEVLGGDGASNHIAGFDLAMGVSDYAGIVRATYPLWKGQVSDVQVLYPTGSAEYTSDGYAVTTKKLRDFITAVEIRKERPTVLRMHPSTAAGLSNKIQTQVRYNDPGSPIAAGNLVQWFDGIPILTDKDISTGKVYAHSDGVKLIQLPQRGWPFVTLPNGLRVYLQMLPDDGSGVKMALKSFVQLQVDNPVTTGYLQNLV